MKSLKFRNNEDFEEAPCSSCPELGEVNRIIGGAVVTTCLAEDYCDDVKNNDKIEKES